MKPLAKITSRLAWLCRWVVCSAAEAILLRGWRIGRRASRRAQRFAEACEHRRKRSWLGRERAQAMMTMRARPPQSLLRAPPDDRRRPAAHACLDKLGLEEQVTNLRQRAEEAEAKVHVSAAGLLKQATAEAQRRADAWKS